MPVVFIVQGDVAVSEPLASMIRAAGWHTQSFPDAQAFLGQPRMPTPACVVMDVEQLEPCGPDLKTLFAQRPETPVIFTAKCPKVKSVVAAMKAGAVDFLTAPPDELQLRNAIRLALECSHALLAHETEVRAIADRYESLSLREREVMAAVTAGRMNKLIADDLGISVITVKAHRGKVMRKMKAASLPDLVNMAARLPANAPCTSTIVSQT